MSLPNYDSVKQKIIETLVGRPEGTEIDPANQQNYELSLLDYVKSVETSSQTPFKGIADENTVPLQPNSSFISYISVLNSGQSKTFQNFRNQSGQPISVTADSDKSYLIILVWNTQYWSVEKIAIAVKENGGSDYTLPVATSSVLGGIKPGAGLTTAKDGTTRIADNANLPGEPSAPNNISTSQVPTSTGVLATKKYVASVYNSFDYKIFGENNKTYNRYIFPGTPSTSSTWHVNLPLASGVNRVSVFFTDPGRNSGGRKVYTCNLRLVDMHGVVTPFAVLKLSFAAYPQPKLWRIDFYVIRDAETSETWVRYEVAEVYEIAEGQTTSVYPQTSSQGGA